MDRQTEISCLRREIEEVKLRANSTSISTRPGNTVDVEIDLGHGRMSTRLSLDCVLCGMEARLAELEADQP